MALDTATSALLTQLAEAGGKPMHEGTPEEARAQSAGLTALQPAGPDIARSEDFEAGPEGARFGMRLLVPHGPVRGVVVYFHGGGWVLGTLDAFDGLGRRMAAATGCAVLLADYRLAPEHPFPAASDDAFEALLRAEALREDIAGPGAPLVVAGDSAGGNLAALCALRARDEDGPRIALQVLVYPVTDCDPESPSYRDPANQLLLTRDTMAWFWQHYVPDPALRLRPEVSPLRAEDLTGLPPAEVLTAEHDVLRDEGEAYAHRLLDAGVPVRLRRFDGQMHGFFTMTGLLPGSDLALAHIAEATNRLPAPA